MSRQDRTVCFFDHMTPISELAPDYPSGSHRTLLGRARHSKAVPCCKSEEPIAYDPAELGISLDRSPRAQIGYFPPAAVRHGKSPKCALGRLQLLHGRHQPDERIGYPRQPVGVVSFPRQPLEGWQQRCCAAEARRGAALPWRRSDGSIVAGPKTC